MLNLIKKALNFLYVTLLGNTDDNYLTVAPKAELQKHPRKIRKDEFVAANSEKVDLTQVPILGPDHDKLLEKAKGLYPTSEYNQYKWLMSVHELRTNVEGGWGVDISNNPLINGTGGKSRAKWGVPGMAGVPVQTKDKGFAQTPLSC